MLIDLLLLGDRELELHLLGGQLLVHRGEGVKLGLDVDLVLRVQIHLQLLGAVDAAPHALAHDLRRVHEVLQNGVLHGGERAGAGAGPGGVGLAVVVGAEDGALGDDNDVLATAERRGEKRWAGRRGERWRWERRKGVG